MWWLVDLFIDLFLGSRKFLLTLGAFAYSVVTHRPQDVLPILGAYLGAEGAADVVSRWRNGGTRS